MNHACRLTVHCASLWSQLRPSHSPPDLARTSPSMPPHNNHAWQLHLGSYLESRPYLGSRWSDSVTLSAHTDTWRKYVSKCRKPCHPLLSPATAHLHVVAWSWGPARWRISQYWLVGPWIWLQGSYTCVRPHAWPQGKRHSLAPWWW